ncbi:MAG: DUF6770 family protein [Saprospiraceae bacterium]
MFFPLNGQLFTYGDVEVTYLDNSGVIRADGKIAGYFMVYSRRLRGRDREIVLKLLDAELNELSEKTYLESDRFEIRSVAYSNGLLGVETGETKFLNGSKKLTLFDNKAELVREVELPVNPFDSQLAGEFAEPFRSTTLISVANGFLAVDLKMAAQGIIARVGYNITHIPADTTMLGWTVESSAEDKLHQGAIYLASDENTAVFGIFKRKGNMSKTYAMDILAIDLNTGEKLFTYETEAGGLPVRYLTGRIINGQITLVGQNTGQKARLYTDAPDGVNIIKLTRSGEVIKKASFNFQQDLATHFDIKQSGKIKGMGHLLIHDIGITKDERILIAAEFYRTGMGKISIRDGLLMQLSPDLEMDALKLVEKGSTSMRKLGGNAGSATNSPALTGTLAKLQGMFDFALLDEKEDHVISAYFSGRSEVWKNRTISLYLNSLIDGKLVEDKLTFDSRTDMVRVLPGKPGFVMVIEYDSKEKTIVTRLERLRL